MTTHTDTPAARATRASISPLTRSLHSKNTRFEPGKLLKTNQRPSRGSQRPRKLLKTNEGTQQLVENHEEVYDSSRGLQWFHRHRTRTPPFLNF